MYSQFDKAIVALVMGLIGVANLLGYHFGLTEATVNGIVAAATPVLVWIIPNLPKDA